MDTHKRPGSPLTKFKKKILELKHPEADNQAPYHSVEGISSLWRRPPLRFLSVVALFFIFQFHLEDFNNICSCSLNCSIGFESVVRRLMGFLLFLLLLLPISYSFGLLFNCFISYQWSVRRGGGAFNNSVAGLLQVRKDCLNFGHHMWLFGLLPAFWLALQVLTFKNKSQFLC